MIRPTLVAVGLACALAAAPMAAQGREIVFLAGPKDHGAPGRHEYEKDLRLLAAALDSAPNLSGIRTKVLVGLAPKFDLSLIANASVLVLESGGDWQERERHPFFPPDLTTNGRGYDPETAAWLVQLDSLISRNKIGVMILHYTNWVENWEGRRRYVEWTGGYWVQMISKNPSDQWSMALANEGHPVLRGVRPWQYRDEVFSRFFLPDNPRRTDLLVGTPARFPQGPTVVSWAYERPDGGRGLVFGGVDFHDNMMQDDYRTFLLNAVVWTAGLEVPAGGVRSTRPVIAPPVPSRSTQRSWTNYGGGPDQSKFFAATGITKQNVAQLRVAFTYPQGDSAASHFSPIIVDTMMYVMAKNGSLVALDARTGRELWIHANLRGLTRRGLNYWQSADGRDRRLLFSMGNTLQAIDAGTGRSILTFGDSGSVDLRVGLERDPATIPRVQSGTPGMVFENLIILGSSPGEDYFSPPGHVRAYNVVTGALAWTFHTIPQPGEYGYDTWPKDAYKYAGGANVWGEISLDAARGIAYVPVGSPTYDYYGADRIGANLFGTSLVALNARTGQRLWHYQFVHHDLWDYDPTAAPQLITIRKDGRTIDAVAQATKQGFLFVFDRVTGEPVWPIEERPVPASDVPGEQAWPTQPFPTKPAPFARQVMTANDLTPFFLTDAERTTWVKRVNAARQGLFVPPSLTHEVVSVPGAVGGANWGNTAANPAAGLVYVLNQDFPSFYRLLPPRAPTAANGGAAEGRSRGANAYAANCTGCHGMDGEGGMGPALKDVGARASFADFRFIVSNGGSLMPAFAHLSPDELQDIYAYLGGSAGFRGFGAGGPSTTPSGPVVASGGAPTRPVQRVPAMTAYPADVAARTPLYRTDYGLGHPYIMGPPWSTLTAYDLNTGEIKWKVPVGHDRDAEREGGRNTGVPRGTQRNGMVVTATGLVFSTAKDGRIYAFDADDGRVLWSAELPSGTEGLPAMYEIGGRQYLVVNATTPRTFGRSSRESGIGSTEPRGAGGYVVFSLP